MLALSRSAQLIQPLFGLQVSPYTVQAWIEQDSAMLASQVERIAQALIEAPVAHADESGRRAAASLHRLRTVASQTQTWHGMQHIVFNPYSNSSSTTG